MSVTASLLSLSASQLDHGVMNREEGPLVTSCGPGWPWPGPRPSPGTSCRSGERRERGETAGQSVGVYRDGDIGNKLYAVTVITSGQDTSTMHCGESAKTQDANVSTEPITEKVSFNGTGQKDWSVSDCLIPEFVEVNCPRCGALMTRERQWFSDQKRHWGNPRVNGRWRSSLSGLWLALTGTKLGLFRRELDDKGDN